MAVGDYQRATIVATLHGQLINTTLHYIVLATGTGSQDVALATSLDSAFGAAVLPLLSDEFDYENVSVQTFSPGIPFAPSIAGNHAGAGGVAAPSIPAPSAATVTKSTIYAGRRYRGRVFQAGIPQTKVTDSKLDSAHDLLLTSAWSSLKTFTASGHSFAMVLWHKDTNTTTLVDALFARTPIRVQRRREVGRGA